MSDDQTIKTGSVTTTVSAGSKKDTQANVEGSQGNPHVEKDNLPSKEFVGNNYSKVGLTFGITKSLGNFEFLRIDVVAEDFCEPSKKVEALDEINKLASDYAVRAVQQGLEYLKQKDIAKGGK
jgi:hypothetical protein